MASCEIEINSENWKNDVEEAFNLADTPFKVKVLRGILLAKGFGHTFDHGVMHMLPSPALKVWIKENRE